MRKPWAVALGLVVSGCIDKSKGADPDAQAAIESEPGQGVDSGEGAVDSDVDDVPEHLDLPENLVEHGVPVGVRTVEYSGVKLEVWYPASDSTGTTGGEVDFDEFLSAAFVDHLGDVSLPVQSTIAIRDAEPRNLDQSLPVILFSHGFGGMRVQSFGLTSHLASRGYVVVAPDHPGRMLTDVLPCMFSPPLEGCDLSGFGGVDPAVSDLEVALAWVDEMAESGDLAHLIESERLGLLGHSAGAGTVTVVGQDQERFGAIAAMAGGASVLRDVPVLRMDGTCDGFVGVADESTLNQLTDGRVIQVIGAGHLAFSDICGVELGRLADDLVAVRSDVNDLLFGQMRSLAVDGCPGEAPLVDQEECADGFLSLDTSDEVLLHYITAFMDRTLKSTGPGVLPGQFDNAVVWTQTGR